MDGGFLHGTLRLTISHCDINQEYYQIAMFIFYHYAVEHIVNLLIMLLLKSHIHKLQHQLQPQN